MTMPLLRIFREPFIYNKIYTDKGCFRISKDDFSVTCYKGVRTFSKYEDDMPIPEELLF